MSKSPGQPGQEQPPGYEPSNSWYAPPQHHTYPHLPYPHSSNPSTDTEYRPSAPHSVFIPGAVAMPVPIGPHLEGQSQSTHITNNIYTGETSVNIPSAKFVQIDEDFEWIKSTPKTTGHLVGKAVVAGHEGWDRNPVWVIRAWPNGDTIPGKLIVKHSIASVSYNRKEITVENIEVLCAKPEKCIWVPASYGNIPSGAVPGGGTSSGETLYIGRARHEQSIIAGKVHPSYKRCYIGFCGVEIGYKTYDVLCRGN